MTGLENFVSEFLDYVLSLDIVKDCPINFGDMSFDYCLVFDGVDYCLEIYSVELDHYGMPYRNCLKVEKHMITSYFGG